VGEKHITSGVCWFGKGGMIGCGGLVGCGSC